MKVNLTTDPRAFNAKLPHLANAFGSGYCMAQVILKSLGQRT